MSKPKSKATPNPAIVRADFNRHTCIEFSRSGGEVVFIPLDINGLSFQHMGAERFDKTFSPLLDYPVEKAAGLYAGYAAQLGGSLEAMNLLAKFVTLTEEEIEMATKKKSASEEAKAKAPAAKAPAAKAPAAKAPAAKSASSMFKELIMEGKMSDDQIFAKVQKSFSLDDNKRSYVKWYRNDLTKKGMKPPAAKE